MDSRVSARVPVETRERADEQLKKMGATTTQLINAAYDYVIETGELPKSREKARSCGRKLTDEQRERVLGLLEETTFAVPAAFFEGRTDEEILAEELSRGYEALA